MTKYQFNDDMQEISGFGGEYEACCRRMLASALEWLDAHPDANPIYGANKNKHGVNENNGDAEALSKAAVAGAGEFGPSGAQHQAVIASALWISANGWDAYVEKMSHPGGQVGILKDKLARANEDLERNRKWRDELMEETARRGAIIAEKVLGWGRYKVNSGQSAYGPSQEAVDGLCAGSQLSEIVDGAIKAMRLKGEAA